MAQVKHLSENHHPTLCLCVSVSLVSLVSLVSRVSLVSLVSLVYFCICVFVCPCVYQSLCLCVCVSRFARYSGIAVETFTDPCD